jgi:1-acyl-sn-glycerol-3-phosphate acyltransferase
MWRLYLTNAWLMLMTIFALPFLLLRFRHGDNTSLLMYIYALFAQRLSGIRIAVSGRENIQAGPAVYVMNHQSSLDGIPLGMLRIPRVVIIGKKEVAYIPFIGWAFWLAGNVLINRADGRKAKGQLDAGIHAMQKRKVSIAIFPEGSRNRDQVGFLPFKKGGFLMAIDAQVPVVPVVIESFSHVYDKQARKMQNGVVRVNVLPAIATTGLVHKDAQALVNKTQALMQAEFDGFRS